MSKIFDLESLPSGEGKVGIVTGANIGLGFETAKVLAAKKYEVIMACRSKSKAEEAMELIQQEVSGATLVFFELDLSSLKNVRRFGENYASKYDRLDLLINNAGVMMPPFQKTEDGFELQMGVNYLAHFLLTGLLLELMAKTEDSRIVTLSSLVRKQGNINFEDLQFEQNYNKGKAYAHSKLACLMFAYELQRELEANKIPVMSLAAHPGISNTNLSRYYPKVLVWFFSVFMRSMFQSAERGALPTLRAALDPNAKEGAYYGPDGKREYKGEPVVVDSTPLSHDKEIARKLWAVSEELTSFKFSDRLKAMSLS
jgi:NAD(P)-dependent dehydrogenase (short-subunit alcohol dehydrogenase family)